MIYPNVTDSLMVDSEGYTVLMVCVITTGYPYTSVMWYKDGNEITNNSLTSIYNEQFEGNGLLFTSSILEICSVGPENSGSYSCVARNRAGNDSREFELEIQWGELEIIKCTCYSYASFFPHISAVISTIVISPGLVDYTIDESMTMIAVCVGTGFPQPSISWSFEGSSLKNSTEVTIYEKVLEISGITFVQSFLEVCNTRSDDHGIYSCMASNFVGNESVQFNIHIRAGI